MGKIHSVAVLFVIASCFAGRARAQCESGATNCLSQTITEPEWSASGVESNATFNSGNTPDPFSEVPDDFCFGCDVAADYFSSSFKFPQFDTPAQSEVSRIARTAGRDAAANFDGTDSADYAVATAMATGEQNGREAGMGLAARRHATNGTPVGDGSGPTPTSGATMAAEETGADPVDPAFGEFRETWTDLEVAGIGLDVALVRTYRSRSLARGPLGVGWDLSFHERVIADDTCASPAFLWRTGQGTTVRFVHAGNGRYQATGAEQLFLTEHASQPPDPDHFVLQLADGVEHRFDEDGLLSSIVDRNGNTISITWSVRSDGVDVVRTLVDTVGRTFDFLWTKSTSSWRLDVMIKHQTDIFVHYIVRTQADTLWTPVWSSDLAKNEDLIFAKNMWEQEYTFTYDDRSLDFDRHVPVDVLQDSCAESCGLDPSICRDDPCEGIAVQQRTACQTGCDAECTNACSGDCKHGCSSDCATLCGPTDCSACDNQEDLRHECSQGLRKDCSKRCLAVTDNVCSGCEQSIEFYFGNDPFFLAWAMGELSEQTCISECSNCLLNGDQCPDELDCMASGDGCVEDCIDVSLNGPEVVGEVCGGDSANTDPNNGCIGALSNACHDSCSAAGVGCQARCLGVCDSSCNDGCQQPCANDCVRHCPSAVDLHAMCQDSCLTKCIEMNSLDGTLTPPSTWGAQHETNHNLLEIRLGGALILKNIYGTDLRAQDFDRVVRQEFGPDPMTFTYADVVGPLPGGEVDLCPLSARICRPTYPQPGKDLIERWIGALDDLIVVVQLDAGLEIHSDPEWEVQGTLPLPAFEIVKAGNTVALSPPVQVGVLRLIDQAGNLVELVPTNVPGTLVPSTSSSLTSLPAVLSVVQVGAKASGHPGRILSLLRRLEGHLPRSMIHFARHNDVTQVLPADAAVGTLRVRELARRFKDGAGSAVASAIGDVVVHLGNPVQAEVIADPSPASWRSRSEGARSTLSTFTARAGSGDSLATFTSSMTAARTATSTSITTVANAALTLSSSAQFKSDLIVQNTFQLKRDQAGAKINIALDPIFNDAKALTSLVPANLKNTVLHLAALIAAARERRTLAEYQKALDITVAMATGITPTPPLSSSNATKLNAIKSKLNAARQLSTIVAALVAADDTAMKSERAVAALRNVQNKSELALAKMAGWLTPSQMRDAIAADALVRGGDPREGSLWAVNALKSSYAAWQKVPSALPLSIDVTAFLRAGGGRRPTWGALASGWWLDRMLGTIRDDLLIQDICTGGDVYLAAPVARSGSQRPRTLSTLTDANLKVWKYYSDANGQVVRAISPEGGIRDWNYTQNGNLIGWRSEFGDRHCYQYDFSRNVRQDTWFPAPNRLAPQASRVTRYTWDPLQRLHEIRLPDPTTGAATTTPALSMYWDDRGNLERTVSPQGESTFKVDERGRPEQILAPGGSTSFIDYDTPTLQSRSTTSVGVAGVTSEEDIVVDSLGRPHRIEKTGRAPIEIEWENHRPVTIRRMADGEVDAVSQHRIYDPDSGDVVEIQDLDAAGNIELATLQEFDARGLLVRSERVADGQHRVSCFAYDGRHQVVDVTLPSGRRFGLERSPSGDVVKMKRGAWTRVRDRSDCPVFTGTSTSETMVDRVRTVPGYPTSERLSGHNVQYTYNGYGERIQESDGITINQRLFDGRGRVVESAIRRTASSNLLASSSLTDLNLVAVTRLGWDDGDRVTNIHQGWFETAGAQRILNGSGWLATTIDYVDDDGLVIQSLPGNRQTQTWIDPIIGPYVYKGADGAFTTREVSDDLHTVWTESPSPDGVGTITVRDEFNSLGLPTDQSAGDRHNFWREYDARGRLIHALTAEGTRSFGHDAFGDLAAEYRESDVDSTPELVWSVVADADGAATELFDDQGLKARQAFDAAGRLTTTTFADGTVERFSYKIGTDLVDKKTTRDSRLFSYKYAVNGVLSGVSVGSSLLREFKWDAAGLYQANATDPFGIISTTFRRDSLGRVVEEGSSLFSDPVRHAFAAGGELSTLKAGGHSLSFAADAAGRPENILLDDAQLATLAWTATGAPPTIQRDNNLIELPLLDGVQLIGFKDLNSIDTVIRQLRARVEDDGQVTRLDSTFASVTKTSLFGTHPFAEVAGEAHGFSGLSSTATFNNTPLTQASSFAVRSSDRRGNWTSLKRSDVGQIPIAVGRNDRLTQFNGPVDGDTAGRVKGLNGVDGRRLTLTYDALGEVTKMTIGSASLSPRVDGLGRLVELRNSAGRVRAFQYDGDRIVVEDRAGALRLVVPGPGPLPLAIVDGSTVRYVHRGWNDRAAALSDADGKIIGRYDTTAFGEVSARDPAGNAWTDPFDFDLVLGGQPMVAGFNLQRFGARWYGPEWGRFLTPDPTQFSDGINVYAYVGNRPLTFTDPTGLGRFNNLPSVGAVVNDAGTATHSMVDTVAAGWWHIVNDVIHPVNTVFGLVDGFWSGGSDLIENVQQEGLDGYIVRRTDELAQNVSQGARDPAVIASIGGAVVVALIPSPVRHARGDAVTRLHGDGTLSPSKLADLRKLSTEQIVNDLKTPGRNQLKLRPNGTVVDGNHRVKVLEERGYNTSTLWDGADVVPKATGFFWDEE